MTRRIAFALTASLEPLTVLGRELTFNDWLYYLCWTVALVGYVIAWLMLRGRTGRALRAVRDSETAAQSSGVSLPAYKTLAFGVSAAYAGVAGGCWASTSRGRRARRRSRCCSRTTTTARISSTA